VLRAGLQTATWIAVDDTGARATPARMAFARGLAMTTSPGSPRGPARAGRTYSICCAPNTATA
jgi:hypothetical protein